MSTTNLEENPHTCEMCGVRFKLKDKQSHYDSHHAKKKRGSQRAKNPESPQVIEKPFICDVCKQPFALRNELYQHYHLCHIKVNTHRDQSSVSNTTNEPNFLDIKYHFCCIDCCKCVPNKVFTPKYPPTTFNSHRLDITLPVVPFPCKLCDQGFDTQAALNKHKQGYHQLTLTASDSSSESETDDLRWPSQSCCSGQPCNQL